MGTPDRYEFKISFINDQVFLIERTGVSGGGCVINIHSQNWAILDRSDRRLLASRRGEFLTASMNDIIAIENGPKDKFWHIFNRELRDMYTVDSYADAYPDANHHANSDPHAHDYSDADADDNSYAYCHSDSDIDADIDAHAHSYTDSHSH